MPIAMPIVMPIVMQGWSIDIRAVQVGDRLRLLSQSLGL